MSSGLLKGLAAFGTGFANGYLLKSMNQKKGQGKKPDVSAAPAAKADAGIDPAPVEGVEVGMTTVPDAPQVSALSDRDAYVAAYKGMDGAQSSNKESFQ